MRAGDLGRDFFLCEGDFAPRAAGAGFAVASGGVGVATEVAVAVDCFGGPFLVGVAGIATAMGRGTFVGPLGLDEGAAAGVGLEGAEAALMDWGDFAGCFGTTGAGDTSLEAALVFTGGTDATAGVAAATKGGEDLVAGVEVLRFEDAGGLDGATAAAAGAAGVGRLTTPLGAAEGGGGTGLPRTA